MFMGNHTDTKSITRYNMNKYMNPGTTVTYSTNMRGGYNYTNAAVKGGILETTDWISQDEYDRVSELFVSNDVQMINSSGQLVGIVVGNKDFEYKDSDKEPVYRLSFEYVYSNNSKFI